MTAPGRPAAAREPHAARPCPRWQPFLVACPQRERHVPTSYHDVFLQDILAAPDDDLPRLIYADWLDDHGDATRADFIRVQVQIARTAAGDPCLRELRQREQELLDRHGPVWRRPVPAWLRGGVVFRRGFIDEFNGTASAFFRDDPEDFWTAAPTAAVLRLSGITLDRLTRLNALPRLRRLRELELREPWAPGGWVIGPLNLTGALGHLTGAPALRTLRLTHCHMVDRALQVLLEQAWISPHLQEKPWLAQLEHLGLADNQLTDDCVPVLLGSGVVRRLRTLDLDGNRLSTDAWARLREHLGPRLLTGRK
jgi:uncharacterized protein (TIGR02996 family)